MHNGKDYLTILSNRFYQRDYFYYEENTALIVNATTWIVSNLLNMQILAQIK